MTRSSAPASEGPALGRLLRQWRGRRGQSQLDLSLRAGVSQRHISFIESGRSAPGRETLMTLAEALDVPLRDRNTLLLTAGYAPLYPEGPWDGPEMSAVTSALRQMLRQHDPFPAVVMDRRWNVLIANASSPRFFGTFFDLAGWKGPRNILHLMFDPAGMRPFLANWEEAARSLLQRVYRETLGGVVDEPTQRLLTDLLAYPGVPRHWQAATGLAAVTAAAAPVVPLRFRRGDAVLSYFSLVATVGTPQTVAAQELRLECMFPAEAETAARHREFMGDATPGEPH